VTPVVLRRRVFNNLGGMSRVFPTPKSLKSRSRGLPFYSRCDIRIWLPPDQQLAAAHPAFVNRLVQDWGNGLNALDCSSGGFKDALEAGLDAKQPISLCHVWAEIYCLWLDTVSVRLGHAHIRFAEQFKSDMGPEMTDARVWLFYSDPFPIEFGGLEYAVTGYLNTLFEGRPYNLRRRLDQFVVYRVAKPRPQRRPRHRGSGHQQPSSGR